MNYIIKIILVHIALISVSIMPIMGQELDSSIIVADEDEQEDSTIVKPQSAIILRNPGDGYFSMRLGLIVPLFNIDYYSVLSPIVDSNISPGGIAGLRLGFFLNNIFSLGADLEINLTVAPNLALLFMIPVGAIFTGHIQYKMFEFPIAIGLGAVVSQYKNITEFNLYARPSLGFYWHALTNWSFGINVEYLFIPQIYFKSTSNPTKYLQSRLANMMEISITAQYHF